MAWNSRTDKSLQNSSSKQIPYGAPVTNNAAYTQGRGYHDGWDINRAYREGMKKIVWVFRAIDAIAGNQARLPVIGRDGNNPRGKVVDDHEILELFNTKANPGENSFIFRHRLSAQLLMSTRGAFVEIIRGRNGRPVALHLLPPEFTSPIPDPKKFVAGYEVLMPGGTKQTLKPEQVLWFRHPHPLDPYMSLTPLESAGIAIEIENLAKFYNRNFLINDGRPGGLVVVRGDMDEDDKDELKNRFRGNIGRAGQVTVIASEDGADYIDTGASPRDANYVEMRRLTKEEILAAFGVPESVIGNASGRTFSNAAEELRVFWMETMQPHLEMLARGFDPLDPRLWFEFDTSNVPILILAKQEREAYLMQEYQMGLITANEYRKGTGKETVESDLADSMLGNPNVAPIGNTARAMPYVDPAQQQAMGMGMPQVGGLGAGAPMDPAAMGMDPAAMAPQLPMDPGAMAPQLPMDPAAEVAPEAAPDPDAPQLALDGTPVLPPDEEEEEEEAETKSLAGAFEVKRWGDQRDWEEKAADSETRWENILDRTLERYFERQQRVIAEKAAGAKARKALNDGKLSAEQIFDLEVWNKQMMEDIKPVLSAIVADAAGMVAEKAGIPVQPTDPEYQEIIDAQTERLQKANQTTQEEIAAAILSAQAMDDEEEKHSLLKAALAAIFVALLMKRKKRISEIESQAAFNGGLYLAGRQTGAPRKTWVTRRDGRVRPTHQAIDGQTVGIGDGFSVGDAVLRYPGDPMAPPDMSLGCRCRLRFRD